MEGAKKTVPKVYGQALTRSTLADRSTEDLVASYPVILRRGTFLLAHNTTTCEHACSKANDYAT